MHDLVVRNATVVDGTGGAPLAGDVAIDDGGISVIGSVTARGREEIDATDRIVTPGFVDPHTHYDGQVTWDPLMTPSSWHGVTTVVMGNCGVGFAPAAPDRHDWLIALMEGVEDIPGTALAEGIRWEWETFPEYLDALEHLPRIIDVAAQVTHGSVRAYVMGERGAANEPASADDLSRMAEVVRDGIAAGALGFWTNGLAMPPAIDGRPVPGTFADAEELLTLARAARQASPGAEAVLEAITAGSLGGDDVWPNEIDLLALLSRETGLASTFTFPQSLAEPDRWRELLVQIERCNDAGSRLVPQIACRPLGILAGLQTKHAWMGRPSYEAIAHLPVDEQARRLADPELKSRILAEHEAPGQPPMVTWLREMPHLIFPLDDPPDYEPPPERSLASLATSAGQSPTECMYDLMLRHEGQQLLLFALEGYFYSNMDYAFELLSRTDTVLGLGDGGAHVSVICDGSYPTVLLGHWARDRKRGPRLSIEHAVRKLTSEPARFYGLHDRGTLQPGAKADLNVIDFDNLTMRLPEIVHDLPGGAPRLIQRADGYSVMVVGGVVVQRDGQDTGGRPGRLVRGPQPRRAA